MITVSYHTQQLVYNINICTFSINHVQCCVLYHVTPTLLKSPSLHNKINPKQSIMLYRKVRLLILRPRLKNMSYPNICMYWSVLVKTCQLIVIKGGNWDKQGYEVAMSSQKAE